MLPVWAIPIIAQVASRVIDYAFNQLEAKPEPKKNKVYEDLLKKDRKAYGKLRGNQHV
jgi:hypothetical protein